MEQVSRFQERRKKLRERLEGMATEDVVLFASAVEPHYSRFMQDATFFYFTGLQEPGAVMCFEKSGAEYLFVPCYNGMREQWVASEIREGEGTIDGMTVRYCGAATSSYSFTPFVGDEAYSKLFAYLVYKLERGGRIMTDRRPEWHSESYTARLLWHFFQMYPYFRGELALIDRHVALMRRNKDAYEIDCIKRAIHITLGAQQAAQCVIRAGAYEYEVVAAIEKHFMQCGSLVQAFPSIVATGVNATTLHYLGARSRIGEHELVVVDIGAAYEGYASDITRTYCSSGRMTSRQAELYDIVRKTQEHIASIACPGMYLNNPSKPEHSLNHLARAFLGRYGLERAMPHGIGHYMGLEVHDVGNRTDALMPGDVITIEPGVYMRQEGIGIRIEDDYLITENGVECLSKRVKGEISGE